MVVGLGVVAALGVWGWKTKHAATPAAVAVPTESMATNPGAAGSEAGGTNASAPTVPVQADFQKLKGKWLRPDGGYVLEINGVDQAGKLEAAYLNPRSIHVAKAEASREGSVTKVFIELRDVNYPGSTYTLVYEPGSDQLQGVYFQAMEQQRYEVAFVRTP
jgi:hypothetical protein